DGDFLDVDITDRQLVEQGLADGNHALALDLELDATWALLHDFAVFAELLGRTIGYTFTLNGDKLGIGKSVHHFAQLAIEEDHAVIDDDHALAQFLDIVHVMAGEQNGRF